MALCALILLTGCEEDVAAPEGLDEPFSLYGVLNARRDTQTVAVSPIGALLFDYPESIDASVTSTDLVTGETRAWTDSAVVGERGQRDHIFWSNFRADFDRHYRIDVVRSDGEKSSVTAFVPPQVEISNSSGTTSFFTVSVNGRGFNLLEADVLYNVRRYSVGIADSSLCRSENQDTYALSYTDRIATSEDGSRIVVDLERDHDRLLELASGSGFFGSWVPGRNGLALMKMEVRLLIGEESWSRPEGGFDARILAEPGLFSNVENGYGMVVGGYNHERSVYPSSEAVEGTQFFDFIQRPPTTCSDYCACGWQ
jgi:hypothetical protein